ncbi:hypothetical protein [Nocardia sp. NPDC050793]
MLWPGWALAASGVVMLLVAAVGEYKDHLAERERQAKLERMREQRDEQ